MVLEWFLRGSSLVDSRFWRRFGGGGGFVHSFFILVAYVLYGGFVGDGHGMMMIV